MASSRILTPHVTPRTTSIRQIYIQNLTDLLHVCLLRGEIARARRAWSILIRCREVDWRSRWYWGLALLSPGQNEDPTSTADIDGKDRERWLRTLRVSARDDDKPALLHALVLHLIKHGRYRSASDELDTYLPSYPYFLSASLHTYAGLLSFYLAQPPSRPNRANGEAHRDLSSQSGSPAPEVVVRDPPNPNLISSARVWFAKALEIDKDDQVAAEFIRMIDHPQDEDVSSDRSEDKSDDGMEKRDDTDDEFKSDEDDVREEDEKMCDEDPSDENALIR